MLIRPDGFVRLYERTNGGDAFEHFLYLEVDRSTEPHETLALRTYGYQDYYRRGGLAVRYGAHSEDYKDFPFRVLMVVPKDERRNNMAERLLQNTPPILSMVWLTTFEEITPTRLVPYGCGHSITVTSRKARRMIRAVRAPEHTEGSPSGRR